MFKTFWSLQWVMVGWAVVVLSHFSIENADANEWRVISELPTQRKWFSTAVVDGKIYLIGGTLFENERDGPFGMSLMEVYDPQTNTWQRLADMPTARSGTKAAVVDGKIYVLAGYVGKDHKGAKDLKRVEMYDPQTDTWVRKQDMSLRRGSFGIGVVAGKIYAIGGTVHPGDRKPEDPRRVDLVEVYNPATDTWAKRAKMPTRRKSVRTAVIRDTLYAIGGSGWPPVGGGGGPYLGTIEVYEPRINRWTKRPEMPNPRVVFFSVVIDEKIYLIGDSTAEVRPVPIEVYDPFTGRWRLIPAALSIELPFGVAAVNGKIYAFGGYTEDLELLPTVEVFDTGFRAVTATGKLPVRWGALKAPLLPLRN